MPAVRVCLRDRWPGHEAGQFAFVKFDDDEEPHPFTISSGDATADFWFCGPVEFGKSLRKDLIEHGLTPAAFHQELFHLR